MFFLDYFVVFHPWFNCKSDGQEVMSPVSSQSRLSIFGLNPDFITTL